MNYKIIFMGLLICIILISGCAKKDCPTLCKEIPFSETAPQISQQELNEGWYWGQLDQKKPGTPDNWIHSLEGSKSAGWFAPKEGNLKECDCDKY